MYAIVDFYRDESMGFTKVDADVVTRCGKRKLLQTTSGWKFLISCKYVSKHFIQLKDMKELFPVEVVDFLKAQGIADRAYVFLVVALHSAKIGRNLVFC